MGRENSVPIEYVSIILTGLLIGYFLLITNPPPGLLRYDNNLNTAVPYHLSGSNIIYNFGSISVFIAIFFLISTFLTYVCIEILRNKTGSMHVYIYLPIISILVLGFTAYPYYGDRLALILYSVGATGLIFGMCLYDKVNRKGEFIRSNFTFTFRAIAFFSWLFISALSDTLLILIFSSSVFLIIACSVFLVFKIRKRARKGRLT
jgi:hypothetical protein